MDFLQPPPLVESDPADRFCDMEDDKDRPSPAADAGAGVLAGMTGAAVGLGLGGTPSTTVAGGVVGPAILLARSLYQRAVQARESSAGRAAERAAELLGGLDILEEESQADAERRELAAKVLEGAAQATTEEKIEALSQVLADGLRPGGDVAEATVLALALRDLEGSHVRVLQVMAEPQHGETADRHWTAPAPPLLLDEIEDRVSDLHVFDPVFAVLTRLGLVSDRPPPGAKGGLSFGADEPWHVTEAGYRCLQLLGHDPRAEVTDPHPPAPSD